MPMVHGTLAEQPEKTRGRGHHIHERKKWSAACLRARTCLQNCFFQSGVRRKAGRRAQQLCIHWRGKQRSGTGAPRSGSSHGAKADPPASTTSSPRSRSSSLRENSLFRRRATEEGPSIHVTPHPRAPMAPAPFVMGARAPPQPP
jgi:hypothetical protein